MLPISKIAVFALLAGTTVMPAAAAPGDAPAPVAPSTCCTPNRVPIVTNASWQIISGPSGTPIWQRSTAQAQAPANAAAAAITYPMQAVVLSPKHPSWYGPLTGSQWIGVGNPATTGRPAGDYTYTYHFCLCDKPPGLSAFPAAMSLQVLSDNGFKAYLNNHLLVTHMAAYSFQAPPTVVTATPASFQSGDNELKIVVTNNEGPTGLDVAGYVSGYFRVLRPGERCPRPYYYPDESPR
jgi:hypothetical protein